MGVRARLFAGHGSKPRGRKILWLETGSATPCQVLHATEAFNGAKTGRSREHALAIEENKHEYWD